MASQPLEIAAGVYWLPIRGTNVYFVRSGSAWVLIDTAWANCSRSIQQAAELLFGANARPAAILLTHEHPDHVGSARELARRWDRPVHVPREELRYDGKSYPMPIDDLLTRLLSKTTVEEWAAAASLGDLARAFDPSAGVPGLPDWEGIPTPGHTPGHAAFFRRSDRVLIAGDALLTVSSPVWGTLLVALAALEYLLTGTRPYDVWDLLRNRQRIAGPPAMASCSWSAAQESVAVLARLEPRVLASGHGVPMIGASTAAELRGFSDHLWVPQREGDGRRPLLAEGRDVGGVPGSRPTA